MSHFFDMFSSLPLGGGKGAGESVEEIRDDSTGSGAVDNDCGDRGDHNNHRQHGEEIVYHVDPLFREGLDSAKNLDAIDE